MRKAGGFVLALLLAAFPLAADEQAEHLEHLRMMMRAMSSHGVVIPQPEAIGPNASVPIPISAHATPSFGFTPNSFSVNQGDIVTISLSVPLNDGSAVNNPAHALIMNTYVEQPLNCSKGQTVTRTFVATTPGTFFFACNQPSCGTGHSSMTGAMVVNAVSNPAPAISSVFPVSGSTAGGTTATISGSNFLTSGITTVTFDAAGATNVNVTSSSSISVTTPAHAAGTVSVTVKNPDGQSTTASNAFTYNVPGPSITAINPTTGSTAGGTPMAITGSGFQNGPTVTIGGIAAKNVVVGSSTNITATTPVGPATEEAGLPMDVTVTNPDGLSTTKAGAFTYFVPSLSVISIAPAVGLTGGGTMVTITGTGFTTAVQSSVTFGGAAATSVQVLDAVTLQAIAPAHAAGTVDVVVSVGNSSVTRPAAFTFAGAPSRHRATHH